MPGFFTYIALRYIHMFECGSQVFILSLTSVLLPDSIIILFIYFPAVHIYVTPNFLLLEENNVINILVQFFSCSTFTALDRSL